MKTILLFSLGVLALLSKTQGQSKPVSYWKTGRIIYEKYCQTCHQADGSGAQNMIPPLIQTAYVLGEKKRLIGIVLHGLNGEIKVNGVIYGNEMPSQAALTDFQIASVLTYIRKSFGNTARGVTSREVRSIRAEYLKTTQNGNH